MTWALLQKSSSSLSHRHWIVSFVVFGSGSSLVFGFLYVHERFSLWSIIFCLVSDLMMVVGMPHLLVFLLVSSVFFSSTGK